MDVSWQLALIGLMPVPLILWGSWFYQNLISPRYKRVREAVGGLSSRLENNIAGILVIKSFTAETFESQLDRKLDNSLKRLKLDKLELYQLHNKITLEESDETLTSAQILKTNSVSETMEKINSRTNSTKLARPFKSYQ